MYDAGFSTRLAILLFSTLLLSGCGGEEPPPEALLPEDPYINLLAELQLLESYRYSRPGDSLNVSIDSLKQVIFEKYGATEQEFMVSHEYYRNQIEEQEERISRAIDRLLLEDSRLREAADSTANR